MMRDLVRDLLLAFELALEFALEFALELAFEERARGFAEHAAEWSANGGSYHRRGDLRDFPEHWRRLPKKAPDLLEKLLRFHLAFELLLSEQASDAVANCAEPSLAL